MRIRLKFISDIPYHELDLLMDKAQGAGWEVETTSDASGNLEYALVKEEKK